MSHDLVSNGSEPSPSNQGEPLAVHREPDSGRPAGDGGSAPGRPGPTVYLETKAKDSGVGVSAKALLRGCPCKSWFCPDCCRHRGQVLRDRLVGVLATFAGLQMWTLTIDPELFANPKLAFEHVRKRRCIAELIRTLFQAGHLASKRFFYVIEWQQHTEMPHYHLLLDTTFVPFELVCERWNRFRPAACGPVVGDRPGFGAVRFSKGKQSFQNPLHAARYATKYLTKTPAYGYPAWVLEYRGQIHRYYVSRNFWGQSASHPASKPQPAGRIKRRRRRSIQERLNHCKRETSLFLVNQSPKPDGTPGERLRFLKRLKAPLAVLAERLGKTPESLNAMTLELPEAQKLLTLNAGRA